MQSEGPFQFLRDSLSGSKVVEQVVDSRHSLSGLDAIFINPAAEVGGEGLVLVDEVSGGAACLVEEVEDGLDVFVEVHLKIWNNYK